MKTPPLSTSSAPFDEVGGYDEIILLRDIPFISHCEHHLALIEGKAHIACMPVPLAQAGTV